MAAAAATRKCGAMNTLNLLAGEIDGDTSRRRHPEVDGGASRTPPPSRLGQSTTRAERHADACRRVAFRGLGYGGGGGDDSSSSPADAASGSGATQRVGGTTAEGSECFTKHIQDKHSKANGGGDD